MIYIYNDFGGTHTSVMAASYHLGRLDESREPTEEEILGVPYFNELEYQDRGQLIFHGEDSEGHRVYTMARGRSKILVPGLCNLIRTLQETGELQTRIVLSNTSPTVPLPMTIGGFLSRMLRIHLLGVPLLLMGAKMTYPRIIRLVHRTKETARAAKSELVILNNSDL
ncbi:DUF3189 family protein [Gorillibacterium sp. sgz5001074]|uniref:DUF3189 family protein n=1 Tax=Gorillibacterium sp. sgz5001074 TaxID=3446695 RepID=UPI003F679DCF